MKTERVLVVLLAIAVVALAVFCVSMKESLAERPSERWLTNTVEVEVVRTNSIVMWRTNTAELWHTNTVVQYVTNQVVREMPVRMPEAVREAAMLGYRYDRAPAVDVGSDSLYKAAPVMFRMRTNLGKHDPLSDEEVNLLEVSSLRTLRANGVTVVEDSPYALWLEITSLWATEVPAVVYCMIRLELRQEVLVRRQNDAVKCEGIVWRASNLGIVPKVNTAEDLARQVQSLLQQFSKESEDARSSEQRIESTLPKVPAEFLSLLQ